MKVYRLTEAKGLDALESVQVDDAPLGARDVRVEMRAWSLNYRDLGIPSGGYPRNDKLRRDPPLIPLSDGAGEVLEVGAEVERFAAGDRVATCFFQNWDDGEPGEAGMASALGGGVDGVLAERVVLRENGLLRLPAHLSLEQGACLPCAAVTAWHALTLAPLTAGDTILTLGTGGVSIFALQLAKAHGARVLITSSSDEKLERARALGADGTINYRAEPEWEARVRELSNGVGVDNVMEVGGAGTLEKSLAASRIGGTVSLIGVLTGPGAPNPSTLLALFNRITIRGIYVGSRAMFEAMNRAIAVNRIEPVIDRRFAFEELDEIRGAYAHLQSGQHFGKVVIARA